MFKFFGKSYYDNHSYANQDHDYANYPRFIIITNYLRQIYDNKRLTSFLDIGSGSGTYIKYLSKLFDNCKFLGIDISKKIEEEIPLSNVKFLRRDIQTPVKIDTKFDFILASEVIEHLENTDAVFLNAKNLLSRGGATYGNYP